MKNKTYEINNISQILNIVTDENIEVFYEDFAKFLILYNESIKRIREQLPNETKDLKNTEILNAQFVWTDDGVSEIKGYKLVNKENGLVEEVIINK